MNHFIFFNFETSHTNYFESYYRNILYKISKKIKIKAINIYYKSIPEKVIKSSNYYSESFYFINKYNFILKLICINFSFLFKKNLIFYFRSIIPFVFLFPIVFLRRNKFIFDFDGDPLLEKKKYRKKTYIFDKLFNLFQLYAFKHSTIIVTRTKYSKIYLIKTFQISENKIIIISNSVNNDEFKLYDRLKKRNLKKKLGINKDAFILIYSGSIGKQYLINKFLRLHCLLKKNISNYHAIIFSNSTNLNLINFKNDAQIKLLNLNNSDYKKYLCIGDIGYALRDQNKPMMFVDPIKYGEYLSSGLYVLYSNLIGSISDIQSKNSFIGYRSYNNNVADIYKIIIKNKKVITSQIYKLKRKNFAKKHYDYNQYVKKIISLVENI